MVQRVCARSSRQNKKDGTQWFFRELRNCCRAPELGNYAQCETVRNGLGLSEDDELVGFLYLGTPAFEPAPKPQRNSGDYFEFWQ